ncbi:MAG: tetratricopeptide repeat protein, partial [Acidobacteria bacterium]|nr:tetratricopeptide repeat protein [Acidobacteriota bacterium]
SGRLDHRAALLVLPAALFLLVRWSLLGAVGSQVYARGVWENILGQALVSLRMMRLTILPIGQSIDPEAGVPSTGPGLAALAACGMLLIGAILLARVKINPARTEHPPRPIHLIACGVLIAAAATAIYWLVPLPDLMSERRAYLPMLGAAIVVAGVLHALLPVAIGGNAAARGGPISSKLRFLSALPVLLLMLNLGPLLHLRARIWADPVELWTEAARRAPTRVRPYVNLGVYAAERGDLESAAEYFDRAVTVDPTDHEALFNRAKLRMDAGDLAAARADLEGAIASNPGMLNARINLSIIFIQQGEMIAAEETLRDVLAIDPGEPRALTNLAEVLRATDRTAEAKPLYLQALASDPGYAHAAVRLGVTLEGEGDLTGALDAYRQYLDRGAAEPEQERSVRDRITEIERRLSAAPGAARRP